MATSAEGGGRDGPPPGSRPLSGDERSELLALRRRAAPRHRLRAAISALLITLAALLAPLATVAVWVADQMGDTDRYVATVAPLASKPDVQKAVADRVTDAVMTRIDLDALLSAVTPDERPHLKSALGVLSGPITEGIKDFVHQTVANFVATDAFATIWTQLNRQAHAAFTGVLTGDSDSAVRVRGDAVVLDLAPVVDQVRQRLVDRGLTIASRLPTVRADFTLVESKDVRQAKTWFHALQLAGNWLPPITLILAAIGVLLARRRRRALVTAALAIAVGVAALGVGLALFRVIYVDHLPTGTNEQAAGTIYDQLVRFLRVSVRMIVVLGVVVALGAWLSGPGRWAVRVRAMWESGIAAVRQAAGVVSTGPVGPWVHRFRYALRWAVVLMGAVALLLWSFPTGMVIFWIAVVVVGALAVLEFLDDGVNRAARG
ncbi:MULTISPECIES: hypothetical protein [unclassified Streptomyces]|uniref:hypothetical protein n=1 Tax=unclassified Streptomyces TaxID=2593676 RepID=UPI002E2D6F6F|nr:hypothetical protein [Streptomyces sp. NBC_00223]